MAAAPSPRWEHAVVTGGAGCTGSDLCTTLSARRTAVYDEAEGFGAAFTTVEAGVHGTATGIVRLFDTYGPRMRGYDGRAVSAFVRQALAVEPIELAGSASAGRFGRYRGQTAG
ncbi:hypothetical protein ACWD4J_12320 [Streptomyces sp. NPDC002577]